MSDPQVTWHQHAVSRTDRARLNGHEGCVVWFTGLSGSGKSTVANLVEQLLHREGVHTYLLDGDNVRHGLSATPAMLAGVHGVEFGKRFGLGFSAEDRVENIRRIGAVAKLFCEAGLVTLTAFVSPYRADREAVRAQLASGDFIEVFVNTPLEICEQRDPKGLYKKARAGELKNMTGIDDPYESPTAAELTLAGGDASPTELAQHVVDYLKRMRKIT